MIPNREGWYYIPVKQPPALLRAITSEDHGVFHSLDFLQSFRTEKKLKSHKKVCENKIFCNIGMPSEDTKVS